MSNAVDSLFLPRHAVARKLFIASMFFLAFGVRLFHMDAPGFSPLRQNYSTIIARALYYEGNVSIPEWKKQVADHQLKFLGEREPRVMENAVAFAYRLSGGERLSIPRLLSVFLWMIGGGFLYLLAKRMTSVDGAVFATAVYLFLPFGTVASRAFMPEPLMIMMLIISLFTLERYFENQTPLRLLLAIVAASLSMYVKAPAAFPILGAILSLLVWKHGLNRSLINPKSLALVLIILLLPGYHYGSNLLSHARLAGYAAYSFRPYLLLQPTFWAGWLAMIHLVLGLTVFCAAVFGTVFLQKGRAHALLLGSWMGYFVFCLVVPYQASTHDYYHLIILPTVALSAASTLVFLMSHVQELVRTRAARLGIVVLCLLFGAAASGVRILQYSYDRQARWQENERRIAQEIGQIVGHSTKTLLLAISSGVPLQYYAEIGGVEIATTNPAIETYIDRNDQGQQTLEDLFSVKNVGFVPDYFIVTELLEFKRRPDLVEFCSRSFPLKARGVDYLIYDLRKRIPGAPGL